MYEEDEIVYFPARDLKSTGHIFSTFFLRMYLSGNVFFWLGFVFKEQYSDGKESLFLYNILCNLKMLSGDPDTFLIKTGSPTPPLFSFYSNSNFKFPL